MPTLSPKTRFQKSPLSKAHIDLSSNDAFHETLQSALAEMAMTNSSPPDLATAASHSYRMEGAKQFIAILLNLAELAPPARKVPSQNLDHNA